LDSHLNALYNVLFVFIRVLPDHLDALDNVFSVFIRVLLP